MHAIMQYITDRAAQLAMLAVLVLAAVSGLLDPDAALAFAVIGNVDLTKAIDELGTGFKNFRAKYDARLEDLELRMDRPGNPGGAGRRGGYSAEQNDYKAAFLNFVRNPNDQRALAEMQEKAVTIGTPAAGGYALPEELYAIVQTRLLRQSPIRRLARVVTASSSDFKLLVDTNGTGYGWVGEGDTRSETDTPSLGEVAPPSGIVYSYPKASEESMLDIFFNVEEWLTSSVARHHALAEGIAFVDGNGTKKPKGFLAGTIVATDDTTSPARAFAEIQYVPTGKADGFLNMATTSPCSITISPSDCLIDLLYTLPSEYRMLPGTAWAMNSRTAQVIRKFKDADGNYLWQPGLIAGEPAHLLGYPVVEVDQMPDIGANSYPVAFANWPSAYTIVDYPQSMRITRDEVTTPGQVKFYVRKRVGGVVTDNYAIRLLKVAVS